MLGYVCACVNLGPYEYPRTSSAPGCSGMLPETLHVRMCNLSLLSHMLAEMKASWAVSHYHPAHLRLVAIPTPPPWRAGTTEGEQPKARGGRHQGSGPGRPPHARWQFSLTRRELHPSSLASAIASANWTLPQSGVMSTVPGQSNMCPAYVIAWFHTTAAIMELQVLAVVLQLCRMPV